MYTLGINAYHGDSSACIYKDLELIAATEEERIVRLKHWAGLPVKAIEFCLADAGITLKDVQYITVSRDPKAKLSRKILYALGNTKSLSIFSNVQSRAKNSVKITGIKKDLAQAFGYSESELKAEVHFVEHHRSHMASSFFVSPFEEAAILSVDGFGDFSSTMRAVGKGNDMKVLDSVSYPHSLGIFYTAFTQLLGFPHYGDEYKVMGLAPYGKPTLVEEVRKAIKLLPNGLFELNSQYFRHFKEGVASSWEGGDPHIGSLFSEHMAAQFGILRQKDEPLTQYHKDLAHSVQKVCEEVIFYMLNDLHQKTGLDTLCITGGVAQNSVCNGKITSFTPFKRLFIPPAGHDAGTSVGSALYHLNQTLKMPRGAFKPEPYTGAKFSDEEIATYLTSRDIQFENLSNADMNDQVSDCLLDGGVIGWFQGRAEFGPRALGNRSILADPRRNDAKEILNAKIKRRESFRPFAPSILKEFTGDYFEKIDDVPFMEKVFLVKEDKRAMIPAVTHADGTGRLQTVTRDVNEKYYDLIHRFYEKSGVPILLNTSFNENEPIVNTPAHALECFLRTKMDMLVLGNLVVKREANEVVAQAAYDKYMASKIVLQS
jgi:carbamoyltransferase